MEKELKSKRHDTIYKMGQVGFIHVDILMVPTLIENTVVVNKQLLELTEMRSKLAKDYFLVDGDGAKEAVLDMFDKVSNDILLIIGF